MKSTQQPENVKEGTFFAASFIIFLFCSLWVLGCSLYFEGLGNTLFIIGLILTIFHLTVLLLFPILRVGIWVCIALLLCLLSLYIFGSYNYLRDVIWLLFSLAASFALVFRFGYNHEDGDSFYKQCTKGKRGFVLSLLTVLTFWSGCSFLDFAFESARSENLLDPNRFTEKRLGSLPNQRKIGLALSGGGYRAALMHAGVLNALDNRRVPISVISSVSGGSIIGSYYTAGGDPGQFRRLLVERRFNLRRELSNIQNAARLLVPLRVPFTKVELLPFGEFGRSDVQANVIDRLLLHNAKLSDLRNGERPKLMIGTTELRSGNSVGFSPDGIFVNSLVRPEMKDTFTNLIDGRLLDPDTPKWAFAGAEQSVRGKSQFVDVDSIVLSETFRNEMESMFPGSTTTWKTLGDQRVSKFVAASGAFPGAFNAVPWQQTLAHSFVLADGGIYDNSGINLLLHANETDRKDYHSDVIIASDASAFFEPKREIGSPLDQVARSIDIIYASTGTRPYFEEHEKLPRILLSPSTFYPSQDKDNKAFGSGISRFSSPENIRDFVFSYLKFKYDFEPSDFGDIELLVSSLPAGTVQTLASDELRNVLTNGYIDDERFYLNYGEGKSVRHRLARLDEAIAARAGKPHADDETWLRETRWMMRRSILSEATTNLSNAIEIDVKNCLSVFARTSTLDDQLSEEDVNALFRLGQYLAILNWPSIRRNLVVETKGPEK